MPRNPVRGRAPRGILWWKGKRGAAGPAAHRRATPPRSRPLPRLTSPLLRVATTLSLSAVLVAALPTSLVHADFSWYDLFQSCRIGCGSGHSCPVQDVSAPDVGNWAFAIGDFTHLAIEGDIHIWMASSWWADPDTCLSQSEQGEENGNPNRGGGRAGCIDGPFDGRDCLEQDNSPRFEFEAWDPGQECGCDRVNIVRVRIPPGNAENMTASIRNGDCPSNNPEARELAIIELSDPHDWVDALEFHDFSVDMENRNSSFNKEINLSWQPSSMTGLEYHLGKMQLDAATGTPICTAPIDPTPNDPPPVGLIGGLPGCGGPVCD